MKILIIYQYYQEEFGTGGTRFNEMARIWKEAGHEITVIAGNIYDRGKKKRMPEYEGKFVTKKNQNGIRVYRCNVSLKYDKNFIWRLWGYFSFVFSGSYAGLFKLDKDYDITVVSSPPIFVGIIAYLLKRFKKIPYVFEVRDLWPESAIDTGLLKNKLLIKLTFWLEGFLYKNAIKINTLTPAFKKVLINQKKIEPDKVLMIPNAADFTLSEEIVSSYDPKELRKKLGLENKFVIAYVGAHGLANGLHQILTAADMLRDTDVLFLLIGNGMMKPKLIKQMEEMKLTNVIFHDSVPRKEVFKYILASDMGISILIKNDTFKTIYSNKTFDYMSCKKPVLMVIDGISRDLIEDADAGTFCRPEETKDLVQTIKSYMDNPTLIEKQGLNGYYYAKNNFDRAHLAVKYLNHLQDIINQK